MKINVLFLSFLASCQSLHWNEKQYSKPEIYNHLFRSPPVEGSFQVTIQDSHSIRLRLNMDWIADAKSLQLEAYNSFGIDALKISFVNSSLIVNGPKSIQNSLGVSPSQFLTWEGNTLPIKISEVSAMASSQIPSDWDELSWALGKGEKSLWLKDHERRIQIQHTDPRHIQVLILVDKFWGLKTYQIEWSIEQNIKSELTFEDFRIDWKTQAD